MMQEDSVSDFLLQRVAAQFATPFGPTDDRLRKTLAAAFAESRRQLQTSGRHLCLKEAYSALDVLSEWVVPTSGAAWHPYVSWSQSEHFPDKLASMRAIQFAIYSSTNGCAKNWAAQFPIETAVVLDSYIVRQVSGVSVTGDSADGTTIRLDTDGGEYTVSPKLSCSVGHLEGLVTASSVSGICVLGSQDVPATWSKDLGLEARGAVTVEATEVLPGLQAASEALMRYCKEYHQWVRNATRYIVGVDPLADRRVSGSSRICPGLVYISHPNDLLELAEDLVHESSHQTIYLYEMLGPLADAQKPVTAWSPFARAERTADRLLLAYHAFTNVLLLHEKLLEYEESHAVRRIRRTIPDLLQTESAILSCDSLTREGSVLFSVLRNAVAPIIKSFGSHE
jgi:hypothetical protein